MAAPRCAIEINPFFYNSWFNKGISLYHLKRCQEAADAFEKALQIKADAAEAAAWRKKAQDECTE
ncbi:MAG: tetratricopeptide repeat protein [Hormoscilla sp. GM7CHS1pb]|nr:tetratricopeptide repeat protein [Hormoscilla sp. GM7CHS1pb]